MNLYPFSAHLVYKAVMVVAWWGCSSIFGLLQSILLVLFSSSDNGVIFNLQRLQIFLFSSFFLLIYVVVKLLQIVNGGRGGIYGMLMSGFVEGKIFEPFTWDFVLFCSDYITRLQQNVQHRFYDVANYFITPFGRLEGEGRASW